MLVTAIIPTVDGRQGHLAHCLGALANQPYDMELIVLRDRPTCGAAWAEGARESRGDYIAFLADDLYVNPGYFAAMIAAVDAGMCPSAVVYEPGPVLQSAGIQGWDCYRPDKLTDWAPVEHTTTPFMSRAQWDVVAEHAHFLSSLHYCSDMLVSAALSRSGVPVVVRTAASAVHYNATIGRGAGMGQHTRTAHDRAAFARYFAPEEAA